MLDTLEQDWRKLATAATQNGMDVEKAFLDQAYTFLQNKAGPIMKAPHRIGFEIVHKNDDNTRMAGIFVFRVGKDLFYAPVFFINGSIKGTDLFYRCSQKRFVPLVAGWVTHLMNTVIQDEGAGLPTGERSKNQMTVNFRQLAFPPGYSQGGTSFKFASVGDIADPGDVKAMIDHMKASLCSTSILERFIKESAGVSATQRLAGACEKNFKFADALYRSCPWMDTLELQAKKQAAAPQDLLILHLNTTLNKQASSATEEDRIRGYMVEDRRKDAHINTDVFDVNPAHLGTFEMPGVYSVPQPDGGFLEVLLAYEDDDRRLQQQGNQADSWCTPSPTNSFERIVGIDPKTGQTAVINLSSENPFFANRTAGFLSHEAAKAKPEAGKGYRLYDDKAGSLSAPFFVKSVDDNKVTACWHNKTSASDEFTILINPDYPDFKPGMNVAGACCRFVEVNILKDEQSDSGSPVSATNWINYDHSLKTVNKNALDNFIRDNHGYKQASVQWDGQRRQFILQREGQMQADLRDSWIGAEVWLMTKCALRQKTASEILEKVLTPTWLTKTATADGKQPEPVYQHPTKTTFWHQPAEKIATGLRPPPFAGFDQDMDDDFGNIIEPQSRVLMGEALRDQPTQPEARADDMYRGEGDYQPTNSDSGMDTMNPMQLFEMAQEQNMPNLFDHGVVGSLLQTYDSMALVDRYLPDLETALDCMGRILFLFYWKPEDFSQAYGSDDMSALENKLLSNFRSFGALVLELIQKTKPSQQGNAALN